MEVIIGILALALILGLLFRNKGDGFMDTLQSGCWIIIVIVAIVIGLIIFNSN